MWERMIEDEYAALESATGSSLEHYGIWWRKVRPFFYRPLLPFEAHDFETIRFQLPPGKIFQFGVNGFEKAQSCLNMFMYKRFDHFGANLLSKSRLRNVRRGLEQGVKIRRLKDPSMLIKQGCSVYRCFFKRSGYAFNRNRLQKDYFKKWCHLLFQNNKTVILGTFLEDKLLSFEISCLVGDTVILKSAVNSQAAIQFNVPDMMMSYYKDTLKSRPDVNQVFDGYVSSHAGINYFKKSHGAVLTELPAYINLPRTLIKIMKRIPDQRIPLLLGLYNSEL